MSDPVIPHHNTSAPSAASPSEPPSASPSGSPSEPLSPEEIRRREEQVDPTPLWIPFVAIFVVALVLLGLLMAGTLMMAAG